MVAVTYDDMPLKIFPLKFRVWIIDIAVLIDFALLIEGNAFANFRGFKNLTVIWFMWRFEHLNGTVKNFLLT